MAPGSCQTGNGRRKPPQKGGSRQRRADFPAKLIANAGVGVPEILHSGQWQFTDMVGAKPLGLTVCWINRRDIDLDPSVPPPDHLFTDIQSLIPLLGTGLIVRDTRVDRDLEHFQNGSAYPAARK
jgi:hypothetical protein